MIPQDGSLSPVEILDETHEVDSFECGKQALDHFLKRFALSNQRADSARTYVVCRRSAVIAYYSLAAGAVEHAEAPDRVGKGLARHPVPVMLLARVAIDRTQQGRGIGKALIKDALCSEPPPLRRSLASEPSLSMPGTKRRGLGTKHWNSNPAPQTPFICSC